MIISKKTLNEILEAAGKSELSREATKMLKQLKLAVNVPDKAYRDIMDIIDREDYASSVLWQGEDDVENVLIDYTADNEAMEDISNETYKKIVDEVTARVDWTDEVFTSCEKGNEVIWGVIDKVVAEMGIG